MLEIRNRIQYKTNQTEKKYNQEGYQHQIISTLKDNFNLLL